MNVTVTQRAAEKIEELFSRHHMPPESVLRVLVGGCDGCSTWMKVSSAPKEDEVVCDAGGVRVAAAAEDAKRLEGAEIDYSDDLLKRGFSISGGELGEGGCCGGACGRH
jgi:iron-sulfur cluster assembly accessory protein